MAVWENITWIYILLAQTEYKHRKIYFYLIYLHWVGHVYWLTMCTLANPSFTLSSQNIGFWNSSQGLGLKVNAKTNLVTTLVDVLSVYQGGNG